MARGPKKHLKRVAAPKHWMLDKLTGVFAPRPSTGPHKLRECLPLIIFLRNRLKYALTGDEVKKICMHHFIKIDGKVRTDITYPAGFMDVISIDKTGENFCLIYDTKGCFVVHRITLGKGKYKCAKWERSLWGQKEPLSLWGPMMLAHLLPRSLHQCALTPYKWTWRLARLLISPNLTLVTCAWWLEVLTWEELVWSSTWRDIQVLLM